MEQITLSNIELYYTSKENIRNNYLSIVGEDVHHITKVMRHKKGDVIHVTDGKGRIYSIKISEIDRNEIEGWIIKPYHYKNNLSNITVCIPVLKSQDRLEYALEKCTELGITNILIYEAKRSVVRGLKISRWEKLTLAAMKQSLRSFLPTIGELSSLSLLNNVKGNKIIFEQNSENSFFDLVKDKALFENERYVFIFGPEGGLTEEEIDSITDKKLYHLTTNRLRSETAIVTAASVLATSLK